MPTVRGRFYDQDLLDTAWLVLQEMKEEDPLDFYRYLGRPNIITFAAKFSKIHPRTSIVERKAYFDAFLGNETMAPNFDLETGKQLAR